MKSISLFLDTSVLDLADFLLGHDDPEEPSQPPPLFDGEDPPSLHELFDVSLPEDGFDDFSREVNLIFPSDVLDTAERENEDFRCETPVVEVDLECSESMISTTPEGSVGSQEEEEPQEAGPSSLWGPLEPGSSPRPCRACTYHRIESGDPLMKCSLCYMHETYHQVYSKYLFLLPESWAFFCENFSERNFSVFSGPVSPATPIAEEGEEAVPVNNQSTESENSVYFEPASPVAAETGRAARRHSEEPLDLSLPKRRRQH